MCFARTAIKIESLYIGSKISLQIKLYDAEIRLLESGVKRLLRRPAADSQVHDETARQESAPPEYDYKSTANTTANTTANNNEDDENDEEAIKDDEAEEVAKPPTPPPVAAAPVRRAAPKKIAAKK